MKKETWKTLGTDLIYDILGGALYSLGIYTFAVNAHFAPVGTNGLAVILNYLFSFPIGITGLLLNIPIILLTFRILGKTFFFKSLKSMVIQTIILDGVFPHFPMYTGNPFIACICTGVFCGAGLALIYMRDSSTGGTDFLIMAGKKKWPHLSLGQVTLVIDSAVVLLGGIVYKNVDAIIYGMIATYVTTVVIDKITVGMGQGKMALIVTNHGMEVANKIEELTDRGSTLIKAQGTHTGQEKDMILCACSNSQITKVRVAAYKIDPNALVIITDSNEVFGQGFKAAELVN